MMKGLTRFALIAAVLLLSAFRCSQDEQLDVYLEASQTSIAADGKSQVVFTVFEGNADVTSRAVIRNEETGEALLGNIFTSVQAGTYRFYAEYAGCRSDVVQVIVRQVVVSRFVKNVCLMEFTDAECTFCPDASRYIDRNILQKNAQVHLLAFHEKDQWSLPQYAVLRDKFNVTTTPYAVVDMKDALSLESGLRDRVKAAVNESISNNSVHCAIALTSLNDGASLAKVTVKLYSEKASDYRLAMYVVQDGIKGHQLDGSIAEDDYYHQFVVRRMVSSTIYGDAIGNVAPGTEAVKEYQIAIDDSWNLAKTYVYALAIDEYGYVNNMQVCLLDGGSADYEYKN